MSDPTRIVAWNVCQGGGKRIARLAQALDFLGPSVVVLTEVKTNRLEEWRSSLAQIGLRHQVDGSAAVSSADPYAALLASRTPVEPQPWSDPCPSPNRAVRVKTAGLSVAGIHAPDQWKPAEPFYRWLLEAAAPSLATDALMVGDFNADSSGAGIPFARFFAPMIDGGWTHALRHHDPGADHSSWWSPLRGFPIDHCLLSPSLAPRLVQATILPTIDGQATAGPESRISAGGLSDHRPLLVDLSASASSIPNTET